jgi:L-ascorbate metabolism protein UlaG (beta-lactamase superfamily)
VSTVVTWLGHSTVVLDVDGVRLIADPLLRKNAGPLRRRGQPPAPAQWAGADAVLLSHLHHDHAELRSLRLLPSGVPVITGAPNVPWLRKRNLAAVAPADQEWIEVDRGAGVRISLCPAEHSARPMPHRPNAANGHLVLTPSARIWIAGDTELFDGLSEIPAQAGGSIDLAVVPISGWGPRLSGGHMGPAQAAEACLRVRAAWALPVHWGTLHAPGGRAYPRGWMDRPGPEFVAALQAAAPDCTPMILDIGVPTPIDPTTPRPTRRT